MEDISDVIASSVQTSVEEKYFISPFKINGFGLVLNYDGKQFMLSFSSETAFSAIIIPTEQADKLIKIIEDAKQKSLEAKFSI